MPLPDVALRLDESIGDGQGIGEIQAKGPNVFKGSWGLSEKTAEAFTDDWFFRTGDLGSIDADGYVTIVGREKDLVIAGGLNVYPKEIETLVDAQDGVEESAVFGNPGDDFSERIIAAVKLKAGAKLDPEDIAQVIGAKLARFKRPKEWVIIDALPRNALGKVRKDELRRLHFSNNTCSENEHGLA